MYAWRTPVYLCPFQGPFAPSPTARMYLYRISSLLCLHRRGNAKSVNPRTSKGAPCRKNGGKKNRGRVGEETSCRHTFPSRRPLYPRAPRIACVTVMHVPGRKWEFFVCVFVLFFFTFLFIVPTRWRTGNRSPCLKASELFPLVYIAAFSSTNKFLKTCHDISCPWRNLSPHWLCLIFLC